MEITMIRAFFAWCSVINLVLLLWWVLFLIFAHDFTYRMHSRWFKISVEKFDAIHYAGLAFFKVWTVNEGIKTITGVITNLLQDISQTQPA